MCGDCQDIGVIVLGANSGYLNAEQGLVIGPLSLAAGLISSSTGSEIHVRLAIPAKAVAMPGDQHNGN